MQIGRKWDHLALNVTDPLHDDVGVNVRMESEFPDNFRLEETPEIPGEKKEEPAPAAPAITEEQVKGWITDAMAAVLAAQKPAEPEKPEEPEEAPQAEVAEVKPDPVPEVELPASAPSKKSDDIEMEGDWMKLS
ncbi:MAG: hypothetical protein ACXACE_16845 [Candidatus Thorarchaeota archaeon]